MQEKFSFELMSELRQESRGTADEARIKAIVKCMKEINECEDLMEGYIKALRDNLDYMQRDLERGSHLSLGFSRVEDLTARNARRDMAYRLLDALVESTDEARRYGLAE